MIKRNEKINATFTKWSSKFCTLETMDDTTKINLLKEIANFGKISKALKPSLLSLCESLKHKYDINIRNIEELTLASNNEMETAWNDGKSLPSDKYLSSGQVNILQQRLDS